MKIEGGKIATKFNYKIIIIIEAALSTIQQFPDKISRSPTFTS